MENKDWAYQIIDNDAIKMNNGDNMVDVSTAYLAIDRARSDERHQLLAGWEPTTKSVPTTGLVDVLFSDGTIREIVRSEERRVGKEGRSRWSPYH